MNKAIALIMLVFAVGFNLWLYRLEPTSTIDPNDNAFQFALVDRTNQIWDFAQKKCSLNILCFTAYLVDHWVPNWAQGYNLPFYYSHVPQIVIIGSWKLAGLHPAVSQISQGATLQNASSLFAYYHWVIYLLLSLFPLSVFLALRVIKLPWLAAGLGALIAGHISTDGLYGLDPPSFLWRGWGLSSQLFAMIWLPLAIAYTWKYFQGRGNIFPAALFLTLTAMGHLGIGIIALMSLLPLGFAKPKKVFVLGGTIIFFLSYWVIPIVLGDNYHNISFWDPPWKFASYGAKETIVRLVNGDLFDWGRAPWMTALVIAGAVLSLFTPFFSFAVLFFFWLLLYFGRATWGPLIDLIPGMKEFHLSRFIVGVHIAGLFLIPIAIGQILAMTRFPIIKIITVITFITVMGTKLYPQTISYSRHNDRLIKQANENHAKVKVDEEALFTTLRQAQGDAPGRVYSGRGGGYGKDFRVAETPYYMHLSTYGIPTVLWLPETWSPNSDVEQYFSEDQAKDYDLFGIRYVAAPPKQEPQKFWKLIDERKTWKLYEIESVNYFTSGVRPAIVSTDKRSYGNVVRLWIQSDAHVKGLYPQLTFAKDYPRTTGLPNFKMLDEVTYRVPDGSTHNLFQEPPVYLPPNWDKLSNYPIIQLSNESNDNDMIFTTRVDVPENCSECIVILKQTFHPNWRATIDGKPTQTMTVFPFFLATLVPSGTHEVVFSYQPSGLKLFLLVIAWVIVPVLVISKNIRRGFQLRKRLLISRKLVAR